MDIGFICSVQQWSDLVEYTNIVNIIFFSILCSFFIYPHDYRDMPYTYKDNPFTANLGNLFCVVNSLTTIVSVFATFASVTLDCLLACSLRVVLYSVKYCILSQYYKHFIYFLVI